MLQGKNHKSGLHCNAMTMPGSGMKIKNGANKINEWEL